MAARDANWECTEPSGRSSVANAITSMTVGLCNGSQFRTVLLAPYTDTDGADQHVSTSRGERNDVDDAGVVHRRRRVLDKHAMTAVSRWWNNNASRDVNASTWTSAAMDHTTKERRL
jgi:hypothetical protein